MLYVLSHVSWLFFLWRKFFKKYSIINNHCTPHDALAVKNIDFSCRQPNPLTRYFPFFGNSPQGLPMHWCKPALPSKFWRALFLNLWGTLNYDMHTVAKKKQFAINDSQCSDPNVNILCAWELEVSSFPKIHKICICPKSSKKLFRQGFPAVYFYLFEAQSVLSIPFC